MSTTALRPLPVRADCDRVAKTFGGMYDAVENLVFRIPLDCDPADEDRTVTADHIADAATALDMLDLELRELQRLRERLSQGVSWLVSAREVQRRREADGAARGA